MNTARVLAIALLVPISAQATSSRLRLNAADDYTLALEPDGTLWAWGQNSAGQLGDGTT
ncbi:MAG TPA: RCC1 domain-containing protein, partial [Myxococcales bacterium]|nr:RCC1 domain-containing protein [Myxococcales bacterium]